MSRTNATCSAGVPGRATQSQALATIGAVTIRMTSATVGWAEIRRYTSNVPGSAAANPGTPAVAKPPPVVGFATNAP